MHNLLIIGVGGFLGALLRYSVSGVVQSWSKSLHFPYGTLVVKSAGLSFDRCSITSGRGSGCDFT